MRRTVFLPNSPSITTHTARAVFSLLATSQQFEVIQPTWNAAEKISNT